MGTCLQFLRVSHGREHCGRQAVEQQLGVHTSFSTVGRGRDGALECKGCLCTQISTGEAREVKITGILQRKEMLNLPLLECKQ